MNGQEVLIRRLSAHITWRGELVQPLKSSLLGKEEQEEDFHCRAAWSLSERLPQIQRCELSLQWESFSFFFHEGHSGETINRRFHGHLINF